jgi:hypothetical protein
VFATVRVSQQDKIVMNAMSAKGKLLYDLIGNGAQAVGGGFAAGEAATHQLKSITAAAAIPPIGGIVFIKGTYIGVGGDKLHAEQKLLAVLGALYHSDNVMPQQEVFVGGVKPPCGTCQGVLDRVYARMVKRNYTIKLRFQDERLNKTRVRFGLAADDNPGIRSLDIDQYFPPADN